MITAEEARRISHNHISIKAEKQLQEIEAKIKEASESGKNVIHVKSLMQQSCFILKEKGFLIEEINGQREEIIAIEISW